VSLLHAVPRPAPRAPKERKGLRREPKCQCGHTREFHDCTRRGTCARCIWPSCPKFRPKYPRKKAPRRLKRAGSDREYLAWLHTQPCVGWHDCDGPIQASHLRHHTGLGLKEPDRNAVPMCRGLHEQWEQRKGPFARLNNLSRFAVFMKWIADTQAAYAADRERRC